MSIKLIPLSRLAADSQGTLTECLDSGEALVVELPELSDRTSRRARCGLSRDVTLELAEQIIIS